MLLERKAAPPEGSARGAANTKHSNKERVNMKDQNCAYCMREERGELLDAFGVFICELSVSSLILF